MCVKRFIALTSDTAEHGSNWVSLGVYSIDATRELFHYPAMGVADGLWNGLDVGVSRNLKIGMP